MATLAFYFRAVWLRHMTKKTTASSEINSDLSPLVLAKASLLEKLMAMHRLLFPERNVTDFDTSFLNPQLRTEKSADAIRHWIREAEELEHLTNGRRIGEASQESTKRLVLYVASCAFFAKALLASANGRTDDESWSHVVESNYFLGSLQGRMSVKTVYRQSAIGLDARHNENRAMRAEVFEWLDANMARFKSMDAAAEAIAGNVMPVKFRTARDWVGKWKKLRSTGTP